MMLMILILVSKIFINYYFELFFSKLNIEYEDSDSDEYDSDSEELNLSYTDSDLEDFCNILNSYRDIDSD